MDDLKQIIAKNIVELRHLHGITQAALAQQLNYSDKAVSKWERGESVPDVSVLKNIADIFGVTVDYLLSDVHNEKEEEPIDITHLKKNNRLLITGISCLLVLLVATIVFVVMRLSLGASTWNWLIFLYSVPACTVVVLVFNSVWFNPRYNFIIISVLMWSVLAGAYLTSLALTIDLTLLFVLGLPAQIIIILWSRLKNKPNYKFKSKKIIEQTSEKEQESENKNG